MANKNVIEILIKARDQASKVIQKSMRGLQSSANASKGALQKLGGVSSSVAAAVGAAVTKISGAIAIAFGAAGAAVSKMGIQFNASLEQSSIAFETLLGSAEKSKTMINDLLEMSKNSPFQFDGLQTSAKLMLAMGFNAEQIMPNLQAVGDAVAAVGGNSQTMERISLAMSQMMAKGRISAEEMNQLAENGIAGWDIISEKMGKSTQELMKMGENGKLLAEDVLPLLIEGMNERFGGAMEKQSTTFNGMIEKIKEGLNILFGKIMEPAFNRLKEVLPKIIDFVDRLGLAFETGGWKSALKEIFPYEMANAIISNIAFVIDVVNRLRDTFFKNSGNISDTVNKLYTNIKPAIEKIKEVILKTVELITVLWNEFGDDITAIFKVAWDTVVKVLGNVAGIIGGILDTLIGMFTGDWKRMADGLKTIWSNLWEGIGTILKGAGTIIYQAIKGILDNMARQWGLIINDAKEWGKNIIQGVWEGISGMGAWLKGRLSSWIDEHIPNVVKDVLGIASPSKLMKEYGQYIAEGLAIGIESGTSKVKSAAEAMSKSVTDSAEYIKSVIAQTEGMTMEQAERQRFTMQRLTSGQTIGTDEDYAAYQSGIDAEIKRLAGIYGNRYDSGVLEDMAKSNYYGGSGYGNDVEIPRYHTGGEVTKLGPKEIPAILEEGEIVVNPRKVPKGESRAERATVIVNLSFSFGTSVFAGSKHEFKRFVQDEVAPIVSREIGRVALGHMKV
jgi:tape measure domain-containing protein